MSRVFGKLVFPPERFLLVLVFLFIIVNWILLATAEEIGPPDFYKLHVVAEKLYSGDFKVGIIPPLFSILMYPLGKLLSLFFDAKEAFIIAGRLIALASTLGALWFTYLLLKKITGKWAHLGLVFLAISPWFLKLVSFPITDMLYLFFVAAAFYIFFNQSSPGLSLAAVLGGVLTRFEGVLLILSGIINYMKLKRRYVYVLMGLLPLVLVFFLVFMPRIFAHLKDIILPQKSYLYIFQHPMEFFNVIYGNLLFFIPTSYPYPVKLAALFLLFLFFLYGAYRLFKINKAFTLSFLLYEFLFMVAKGYIDTTDPGREFRRVFSGLWIFYILCFIGCYFLLKKVKSYKLVTAAALTVGGVFLVAVIVSMRPVFLPFLPIMALLVLPFLCPFKDLKLAKIPRFLAIIVLLAFAFRFYQDSYPKAEYYVVSYANKAPYAAAYWLNFGRLEKDPVILSYTDNTMLNYYLVKEKIAGKNIQWVEFTVPLRNIEENREQYKEWFFQEVKARGVDYIIFDNYVVQQPEFLGVNDVKRLLFEERNNTNCFKLRRLYYKSQNVGYVLRPVIAGD